MSYDALHDNDQVNGIDREEDDADDYSEGEMSDEDEFVPLSDDSSNDEARSRSSDSDSVDPNLNMSITEE